jgi:hypothetical protein
MATPRLTPEQIAQVSGIVAQYIATQRERYASRAVPLLYNRGLPWTDSSLPSFSMARDSSCCRANA